MRISLFIAGLLMTSTAFAKVRMEPISPIKKLTGLNKEKVELGKKLYFERRLSKSGRISCNSCHDLALGGADNMRVSLGHGFSKGPINSPTVYNSSYNLAQFWDGRAKDLQEQAGGPIANPGEMASSHDMAEKVINSIPEYKKAFKKVYGTKKVTINEITHAIAEFEKTLVTPNGRFDQWLKGDDNAITKKELKGYETFKMKGCVACHSGPAVGGSMYQKFGLVNPPKKRDANLGRYEVTKNPADKYVFKVPSLRNVELTYPYFHDGSVWDLREAVKIMGKTQLGVELTKTEQEDIVAFLKTLTGKIPSIDYPHLPPSTLSTPHENM